MRKLFLVIFMCLTAFYTYALNPKPIGITNYVKGKVYAYKIKSKNQFLLTNKSKIFKGMVIKTNCKSEILIQFSNGLYQFIPANSKVIIADRYLKKTYQLYDKSIEKLISTGGTKLLNENNSSDFWHVEGDSNRIKSKIFKFFNQGNYPKVILGYKANKKVFKKLKNAKFIKFPGAGPLTPETGVRFPVGSPLITKDFSKSAEILFVSPVRLRFSNPDISSYIKNPFLFCHFFAYTSIRPLNNDINREIFSSMEEYWLMVFSLPISLFSGLSTDFCSKSNSSFCFDCVL